MKIILAILLSVTLLGSCKKCYDCTKKCGYCTKAGALPAAGCDGDEALGGFSVDSWKVALEAQGYSCTYNNTEEAVCGEEAKMSKEDSYFECIGQ